MRAFLGNDSLFLLDSEGFVYGFEEAEAALVLKIEEQLRNSTEIDLSKHFSGLTHDRIEELRSIVLGEKKKDPEPFELSMELGTYIIDEKEREWIVIPGRIAFGISYPAKEWRERIAPLFSHLKSEVSGKERKVAVDFLLVSDGLWQMTFNGREIARPAPKETMPLIIQENMIIATYQSHPYLMALHAGVVGRNGRCVVMPGASGSGKSTLTAAMAFDGYDLFSDEISLVNMEGEVEPLPFRLNLKEGSWKVVKQRGIREEGTATFLRFDGQRVKLFPPRNLAKEPAKIAALIFPKYVKGAHCETKSLSEAVTLKRIEESGYQIPHPFTPKSFSQVLEHIVSPPAYELRYGNLDEAIETIGTLLNG